jgi:hypothetical protein
MSTQALHTKGFASLLTTFSFTVMTVSGILLFIVPQGRIAEWTNWTILGLSKPDWGNIHITTSLMFLIAGAYHIWCNWRTLVNYFTTKRNASLMMRRELAISAVVTLFFVVGAVYQVPPLSYVLEANNAIKMAWIVDKDHEPPIGHAELLTVKSFTKKMQIDFDQAAAALNKGGIRFAENESLAVIAKKHNLSPVQIYQLIKPLEGSALVAVAAPAQGGELMHASLQIPVNGAAPAKQQVYTEELVDERFEGRGMGRKTLGMITGEAGMDLAVAKKKLIARKMEIRDGETLKDAAARMGTAPIELLKIVFVGEPVKI